MADRISSTYELTPPGHVGNPMSRIVPKKIARPWKIRHLAENADLEQEISKGERVVDFFCWSLFCLSALYSILFVLFRQG